MRVEQRAAEAIANGRAAGFARQQDVAACLFKKVGEQPQLRGLAAAVDPFEGNKGSSHLFLVECRSRSLSARGYARQEFNGMSGFGRVARLIGSLVRSLSRVFA